MRSLYTAGGLPEPVISISCHTVEEVLRARASGATLILFGPVFEKVVAAPSASRDSVAVTISAGVGLDIFRQACAAAAPTAVLALGGITRAAIPACLACGASGIAAIRLFAQPASSRRDG